MRTPEKATKNFCRKFWTLKQTQSLNLQRSGAVFRDQQWSLVLHLSSREASPEQRTTQLSPGELQWSPLVAKLCRFFHRKTWRNIFPKIYFVLRAVSDCRCYITNCDTESSFTRYISSPCEMCSLFTHWMKILAWNKWSICALILKDPPALFHWMKLFHSFKGFWDLKMWNVFLNLNEEKRHLMTQLYIFKSLPYTSVLLWWDYMCIFLATRMTIVQKNHWPMSWKIFQVTLKNKYKITSSISQLLFKLCDLQHELYNYLLMFLR